MNSLSAKDSPPSPLRPWILPHVLLFFRLAWRFLYCFTNTRRTWLPLFWRQFLSCQDLSVSEFFATGLFPIYRARFSILSFFSPLFRYRATCHQQLRLDVRLSVLFSPPKQRVIPPQTAGSSSRRPDRDGGVQRRDTKRVLWRRRNERAVGGLPFFFCFGTLGSV